MSHLKNNRTLLFSLIGGTIALVLVGVSLLGHVSEKKELEAQYADLTSDLTSIENTILEQQANLDDEKMSSVKEVTGLDPALIQTDSQEASSYFEQAFNWKSGSDYDEARTRYIESLGEGNAFTETYLPPDTKIDTDDGPLSYIDFKGIKASMSNIHVVPMTAEGDRIRYVAFVQYFMHEDDSDTVNPEALVGSEAIIEFTAAGDAATDGRRITEVTARAGFHSRQDP
ncbi:hypothetical protein HXA34_20775 [Salipaludibacillus agaradhaerens]|uniref:hypothetical protein n=1 Tax=Salipaludibacillus agaradhaerens TaxID=76935 RepID=UPI002151FD96|nr:hypothetical protein [Salipaludibacillus agaradhaerens]MCR6108735.1 hypothetical protein [Salipaludibacillus agaradhaerens]MCR6120758.1 hypothetical protein [Salipaludibacillus agaradhaerens]